MVGWRGCWLWWSCTCNVTFCVHCIKCCRIPSAKLSLSLPDPLWLLWPWRLVTQLYPRLSITTGHSKGFALFVFVCRWSVSMPRTLRPSTFKCPHSDTGTGGGGADTGDGVAVWQIIISPHFAPAYTGSQTHKHRYKPWMHAHTHTGILLILQSSLWKWRASVRNS